MKVISFILFVVFIEFLLININNNINVVVGFFNDVIFSVLNLVVFGVIVWNYDVYNVFWVLRFVKVVGLLFLIIKISKKVVILIISVFNIIVLVYIEMCCYLCFLWSFI